MRAVQTAPGSTVCTIDKLESVAGDWFGPASTANLLREAINGCDESRLMHHPVLGRLCVHVAQDCTVYQQDVRDLCRSEYRRRAKLKHIKTRRSSSSAFEDISVLDVPSEYPADIVGHKDFVINQDGGAGLRLYGGVVEGVPYLEEVGETSKLGGARSDIEEEEGFQVVGDARSRSRHLYSDVVEEGMIAEEKEAGSTDRRHLLDRKLSKTL